MTEKAYYRSRSEAIRNLVRAGHSFASIGRLFGISRQRVEQIYRPKQRRARQAIRHRIPPTRCQRCARKAPLHGHHPNYDNARHVEWLCVPCHNTVHPHAGHSRRKFTTAQLLEMKGTMTYRAFALLVGVAPSTITKWLNGAIPRHKPTLLKLRMVENERSQH
ncbi:hypothetical protein LCGC14_0948660 [marine sediment metagenome]|uniref:Uncharacterized protein n=1 Tax=marine sediment metagenome TaxID=412755 RepID=A0A0F9RPC4_9ZZZZ